MCSFWVQLFVLKPCLLKKKIFLRSCDSDGQDIGDADNDGDNLLDDHNNDNNDDDQDKSYQQITNFIGIFNSPKN